MKSPEVDSSRFINRLLLSLYGWLVVALPDEVWSVREGLVFSHDLKEEKVVGVRILALMKL